MATIRTAIQIRDGMTPAMRSMTNALNICISNFEALQTASSRSVDTVSLSAARAELNKASVAMDSVEKNIREADVEQQQLNNQMRNGQSAAEGLVNKVKQVATGIAAALGVKKILGLSDTVAQTTARLNLMNNGMQTTAQLQNMIFQSAQRSRSSYYDTAAVISRLGILAKDAFSSNQEMIVFSEQMNKQFKIGGASIQEQTAGMYQLTQAMASGRLQGDEFRSIMENAPMLAQAIATYMGKSIGELREMSSEGLITADVIKNALFAAADETNRKFATLPVTFGEVWNTISNNAKKAFEPLLQKISAITKSKRFQKLVNNATNGLVILANVATDTFNILSIGVNFVTDNWLLLEPIVWGVTAAFVVYNATAGIAWLTTIKNTAAVVAHTVASWAETAAIIALEAAQHGLNAALAMCPISWIIIAIIALIAVFYLAIAAVNKFAGTSISATGVIVGVFFTAGAAIGNVVIAMINMAIDSFALWWNFIASFAEFFANVFNDPVGSITRLFANMVDTILGLLSGVASALDALFGSNMAKTVDGWRNSLRNVVRENYGEAAIKVQRIDPKRMHLNRFSYTEAYKNGYNTGKNFENNFDLNNLIPKVPDIPNQTIADIANTASNTKDLKDSVDISTEDLKYLRDIAEQEVINRYTTAEIKIDMTNYNNVNNEMDLDGVTNYLVDAVEDAMQSAAEGVHD
jgi:tape measure domain-containing protein